NSRSLSRGKVRQRFLLRFLPGSWSQHGHALIVEGEEPGVWCDTAGSFPAAFRVDTCLAYDGACLSRYALATAPRRPERCQTVAGGWECGMRSAECEIETCTPQGCQIVAGGRSAKRRPPEERERRVCTPEGCQKATGLPRSQTSDSGSRYLSFFKRTLS